jgi:iron complex outermembrane receptor protein
MGPGRGLSATLACLLAAGTALRGQQAPEPAATSEVEDLLNLLNTPVVSASKHAERTLEAPSVMSLALKDQVDAYGWTSLNDLLYTLPGFSASQDYDRSTVSSRGLFEGWNNNHLLMLVDGIPFNDNLYGSAYTWEITPIFMANTVEVVRGPGSALYGSNAMNGVVQMKTVSAQDLPSGGQAEVRMGQDGVRIYDFVTGHQGDHVSAVVGFSANQSNGDSYMSCDGSGRGAGPNPLEPTSLGQYYVNDARSSQYAWAKLEGEGDLRGFVFQYHYQAWDFGTGHGWLWQIPNLAEDMSEKRQIASLAYTGDLSPTWHQEYMVRHQVHDIDWNTMYYPVGSAYYPDGVVEYLDTSAFDDFLRAQWSVDLPRGSSFLFGFEGDRFLYQGDKSHYANIDMDNNPADPFAPYANNVPQAQGPWLAWLLDRPITTTGFYGQYDSGKALSDKLKVVAGLRLDRISFNYNQLDVDEHPTGVEPSKSFSNTSPRLAFVFMPASDLSFKLMGGKAFRSPAPAELGGANTLSLASNIMNLKPETLTTVEAAMDWIINPRFNWRLNVYHTQFDNEISYSTQGQNLSTNIYTLTTEGLETELLFGSGAWRGFINYSYAKRVNEAIEDPGVAPSRDVTWVPSRMVKAGVNVAWGAFRGSLTGKYTGQVQRRASDLDGSNGLATIPFTDVSVDLDAYRPTAVPAWFTLDTKLTWAFSHAFSASLVGTNLTDKTYYLCKTGPFPFDYQAQGRVVSLVLKASF